MSEPSKSKRRWRLVGIVLLAFVGLHLLVDGLYAAYVAYAIDAWAADVGVDENGVLAGCDAYDLPPKDSEPTGTAVLLVHGFNASPRHWDFVAPALAERGYHCRVTRLPGFAEPYTLHQDRDADRWIEAVAAELKTLRSEFDHVVVVGHSLGGAVTIRTLIDDPDAADSAVLVAPAVAVSDARAPVLSTRTWHEVSQRTLVFVGVVKSIFPMDCHVEGRTDWPGRIPFSSKKVIDELFSLLDRNLPDAERFTTPVTVLVSPTDLVVDTPAAEAYFARLGSKDKELIVLEQSGHAVPLDNDWESIVEAVVERAPPTKATGEPSASAGGVSP